MFLEKKGFRCIQGSKENIIKQKDLIVKNLDLKNSVLNQDLESIIELSLSYLDPINGDMRT